MDYFLRFLGLPESQNEIVAERRTLSKTATCMKNVDAAAIALLTRTEQELGKNPESKTDKQSP